MKKAPSHNSKILKHLLSEITVEQQESTDRQMMGMNDKVQNIERWVRILNKRTLPYNPFRGSLKMAIRKLNRLISKL